MNPRQFWWFLASLAQLMELEFSIVTAQEAHFDLVVIYHEAIQHWLGEIRYMKIAMVDQFPTHFDLGPNKTRVGFVMNSPVPETPNIRQWTSINLTGDPAQLKTNVESIKDFRGHEKHDKALEIAYQMAMDIFDAAPSNGKQRVILVITYPRDVVLSFTDQQQTVFDNTRKAGIQTLAVYQYKSQDHGRRQAATFSKATGTSNNILFPQLITQDWFNNTFFPWLKNKTTTAIVQCRWKDDCFFLDENRKICKKGYYSPNRTLIEFADDCEEAGAPPPPQIKGTCAIIRCKSTCLKLWPRKDVNCTDHWGDNLMSKHPRPYKQLEHCDPYIYCSGPPPTLPPRTTSTTPQSGGMRLESRVVVIIAMLVIGG